MNKMLNTPIIAMFTICLFMFISIAVEREATTENYSEASGITIDEGERTISMPQGESQDFNIWLVTGAIVIIVAAIAIGIVSGIQFLGSGLSIKAQSLLITSFIYLGLWGCLTIVVSSIMFDNILSTAAWLGLTVMFALGLAQVITGDDE